MRDDTWKAVFLGMALAGMLADAITATGEFGPKPETTTEETTA